MIKKIESINEYLFTHKSNFYTNIGSTIKKIRTSKSIKIETLAESLITSTSYISQIENGRNGMSLIKFIAFCNSLEISPKELLQDYVFTEEKNEVLFYEKIQLEKNLSTNILEFLKEKK